MRERFELVVPCYNEAPGLELLISETVKAAEEFLFTPETFQLVLVDNGSVDGTYESLQALKASAWGKWMRFVHLEKNQGYGGGILAGLQSTNAAWVGWTHADLQTHPRDAFRALGVALERRKEKILARGRRKNRKPMEFFISRGYELALGYYWGFWGYEVNAQPKVFPRALIEKLGEAKRNILFDAFVLRTARENGYVLTSIPVRYAPRAQGVSSWNFSLKSRLRTFRALLVDLRTAIS